MTGPAAPARILVVDDEAQIARVLKAALSTQGHIVRTAANALDALALAESWHPDLVLTDLGMPGMSGVELCRELRARFAVPILVLSVGSSDRAKIEALDAGADDYVTKPFSIQELQARVRAHLRRRPAESEAPEQITAGDFFIDVGQHRVKLRGHEVRLTPKQFDLLVFLARHAGQVLTHRALLGAVWGSNADQPEYLRVSIGQLRKKIEPTDEPRYIITEPWIGYRFEPTGSNSTD